MLAAVFPLNKYVLWRQSSQKLHIQCYTWSLAPLQRCKPPLGHLLERKALLSQAMFTSYNEPPGSRCSQRCSTHAPERLLLLVTFVRCADPTPYTCARQGYHVMAVQAAAGTHIVAWHFLLQRQTSHEHVSQASDRRSQHSIHRRFYTA